MVNWPIIFIASYDLFKVWLITQQSAKPFHLKARSGYTLLIDDRHSIDKRFIDTRDIKMAKEENISNLVKECVTEALDAKGYEVPELSNDSVLLGGDIRIDSLDLAGIVVRLQEVTGLDPFKDGFIDFKTIGELSKLYEAK